MRNDLYGTAAVITAAFLLQNAPVYLSGRDIGVFVQTFIDKTLIVSKVKVCFYTIIRYKNLTVLDRIHRARIDIDIRIKFLHRYLVAACFQKTAEGCSGNAFSETGNNTACYKYVFYCHFFFLL